jgi:hypothetical protein
MARLALVGPTVDAVTAAPTVPSPTDALAGRPDKTVIFRSWVFQPRPMELQTSDQSGKHPLPH